jgi:hypothetical protein
LVQIFLQRGAAVSLDQSIMERNHASTNRIRELASRLTDEELQHPVGEHWTVAIALAHIAFWDRRFLALLDQTEQAGAMIIPPGGIYLNDVSLPFWAAVPSREAARIAVESAESVDQRLENFPPALIDEILSDNEYWLTRFQHRNRHLDEVEAALTD